MARPSRQARCARTPVDMLEMLYRFAWACRRATYGPHIATIVESDVGEDYSLSVVETNVEIPPLPVDGTAVQLEGYTFRLGDVNRLEVISQANFSLDRLVVVVGRRCLVERATLFRNVNVDDLFGLHAVDGAEVEWVGVLQVVDARSVVHQGLLESGAIGVALVIAWKLISIALVSNVETNTPMVQGSQ